MSDFEASTDVGAGAWSGSMKLAKECFDDLSHYQSMRFVLATATSRIGIIGIGSNKVATERAAYLAPAITDKQTKGGPCEGPLRDHELPRRRVSVPVEAVLFTQRKISGSFSDPSLPPFQDLIARLNGWRVSPDEEDWLELEAVTDE